MSHYYTYNIENFYFTGILTLILPGDGVFPVY